jgi:hypothetical protein
MDEARLQKARSALGNIRTNAMRLDPETRRAIGERCADVAADLIESADRKLYGQATPGRAGAP